MKREIRYRVWDAAIPKHLGETDNPTGNMVQWDYVKESSYLLDALDGKFPIMQFTGLTDKNGVEIYEGDIISKMAYDGKQEYELDGVVVWNCGGFCLKCTKHYNPEEIGKLFGLSIYGNATELSKGEVTGNIHQNPNLLTP